MHCIFYYTYYLYSNISSSPTSTTFALLLLHYCDYSWYLFHHHTPGAGPAPSYCSYYFYYPYCSYYSFRKFLLLLLRLLLLYLWHNLSLIMCDSVRRMRARTFSDAFFTPHLLSWMIVITDEWNIRCHIIECHRSLFVCFKRLDGIVQDKCIPFPKNAFFGGVAEILSSKNLLTFFGTLP